MPERVDNIQFTPLINHDPAPAPEMASMENVFKSAFSMENDVIAAFELLSRPQHQQDVNFKLTTQLQADKIDQSDWEHYVGVRSYQEYQEQKARIQEERDNRQTLAAAGGYGIVASIAAGLVSPTTFIPVLGGASKAGTIFKTAISVAGATALQEAPLLAAQETRTVGEAAFSVGASAVLGGILGGATAYATSAELKAVSDGMANSPRKEYGTDLSAAKTPQAELEVFPDAGKFAYAPGMDLVARLGPVTRGIQQPHAPKVNDVKVESAEYRAATAQFGDAGLVMEGNKTGVAASPGGAIEDQVVGFNRHSASQATDFKKAYESYFFDDKSPVTGTGAVQMLMGKQGKLTKAEFEDQITKTIWSGEPHEISQINEAAAQSSAIFDKLYKEAQEVGIYKDVEGDAEAVTQVVGDVGYAMRDYLPDEINKDYNGLFAILQEHYTNHLQDKFQAAWTKWSGKQSKTNQLIDDLSTGDEEAAKLVVQFKNELGVMEKKTPGVVETDEELAAIRAQASGEQDRGKLKALVQQRKDLIKNASSKYPEYRATRKALSTRLHNLTRSRGMAKFKQRAKLAAIDKNEELSLKVMNRAVRRGQALLNFLQGGSDKKIEKALKEFSSAYQLAIKTYDNGKIKMAKLISNDDHDLGKLYNMQDAQIPRVAKMNKIKEKLDNLKNFDRQAWRKDIQEAINDTLEPYNDLVKRRGVREQQLLEAAKKLDPKLVEARVAKLGKKIRNAEVTTKERMQKAGAALIDMKTGKADFSAHTQTIVEDLIDKLRKSNGRMQWADIIREQRGPEYARVLTIPSTKIARYLDTNINRLMANYVRTMGADITVARKFGSANMKESFARLREEEHVALQELPHLTDKSGEPLSQEAIEKASKDITDFYKTARNDLETLLMRTRHTWGVPDNPHSFATRGARLALNINTARLMGGVLLSSIADPARWVMKFGLANTFKDGFTPMISNFKAFKMVGKEAQLAGEALDLILHSRARQIFDVFDNKVRGSKFEKGVEFAATHIGLVGLFDHWNVAMKQFTAALSTAKLMRSIEVLKSTNPAKLELEKATEYLASKNLTPAHMDMIWKNVTEGEGGGKVGSMWLPNTESWATDTAEQADTLRAFRSALVSDINDTIVTPGLERPSVMDGSIPAKLLFQFKSFGMSSTFKTTMAGLQQRDAAFVNGIMISLALGALSYYLKAIATGGKMETEMENGNLAFWADRAIENSGVMGVFDEIQKMSQHVPYVKEVSSFSNTRGSANRDGAMTNAILGPSYDLLERAQGAIQNIDDDPKNAVHYTRTMLPWQNIFYLRQAFTKIENALGGMVNSKRKE
jgi:hypothetical protein